jgi:putative MATE family efflux protein
MTTQTEDPEISQAARDAILKGSTWLAIWEMSWPMLVNAMAVSLACFADVYVSGQLGADEQAAVGLGGQVWFFMIIMAIAVASGANAIVSRYWGAHDKDTAIEAARQCLLTALLFGVVSVVAGLTLCQPVMHALGASPAVTKLGWAYLKYNFLTMCPLTVLWVCHSIFRATGNARTPMLLMGVLMVLVVLFDFSLCLGPFHLGIAGIGVSWILASLAATALSLVLLKGSDLGRCLEISSNYPLRFSMSWAGRILKIGIPACLQDVAWVAGNFVLFAIFAQTADPTSCQAAWAIGLRVEDAAASMPIYALGLGVATIVGQNLGAKRPDRAEKTGWQAAGVVTLYMCVVSAVMILGAYPIAHLMSSSETVTKYAAQYLQIVGISEPFQGVWLVLFGAMEGAGYTRWPMVIAGICLLGMRLPLAWFLTVPLKMGPAGTWISIAASFAVLTTLTVYLFVRGTWKENTV